MQRVHGPVQVEKLNTELFDDSLEFSYSLLSSIDIAQFGETLSASVRYTSLSPDSCIDVINDAILPW